MVQVYRCRKDINVRCRSFTTCGVFVLNKILFDGIEGLFLSRSDE